jgi:hypothetical protein
MPLCCRCKQWIAKLKRSDLDGIALATIQKRYLCSTHFENTAYMCSELRHSTSRLNWNAIPTVWNHANPPADSMLPHRKLPKEREPLPQIIAQLVRNSVEETPVGQIKPRNIAKTNVESALKKRFVDCLEL